MEGAFVVAATAVGGAAAMEPSDRPEGALDVMKVLPLSTHDNDQQSA
jgi:hypothetical protein